MESDLRKLIDDPQFKAYYQKFLKPKEFNTFDVLQYADYEIRHSNVLAWLLRPADTHGIGQQFLSWFVDHVAERFVGANAGPLPAISLEVSNVDVWREQDYVDITVRFKQEKCLIAVENKTVPASPDHADQVAYYERKLRDKHLGCTVRSVLLTSSPDGSVAYPGIAHVGWESVHTAISSLLSDGKFCSSNVRAFVHQYIAMVEEWLGPTEFKGFREFFDDHHSVLRKMRQVLNEDGDGGIRRRVPADGTDYRDALVRLVKESRQDPHGLRSAVKDFLRGRGCATRPSHNAQGVYWLNWTNTDLIDVARAWGCGDFFLSWGMTFSHQEVRAGFYLYQTGPRELALMDQLKSFMQLTPVNRHKPDDQYPMKDTGYGWHQVYDLELLSKDELDDMSRQDAKDEVKRRLDDFMGSDASEYRRIEDYFQCLAFRFDDQAFKPENSL